MLLICYTRPVKCLTFLCLGIPEPPGQVSLTRASVLRHKRRVSWDTCPGVRIAEDTDPLTLGGTEEVIPITRAATVLKTDKYFNVSRKIFK